MNYTREEIDTLLVEGLGGDFSGKILFHYEETKHTSIIVEKIKFYEFINHLFLFPNFYREFSDIAQIVHFEPLENMPLYIGTYLEEFAVWRLKLKK